MIDLKDLETIRVRDIASKYYQTISCNSTIAEAMSLFQKRNPWLFEGVHYQ